MSKQRRVFVESRYFDKNDHMGVLTLVGNMLKCGKQVAVCPWPNDLKSTVQTQWCVSWPAPHITSRSAA